MATGLITEAGVLIPFVRSLLLRLTRCCASGTCSAGWPRSNWTVAGRCSPRAARLLGTGASGARVAAVFEAAAAEALAESPAQAAELLDAAVDAGHAAAGRRRPAGLRGALAGDLDQALRLADQVIADPAAPDRDHAVAAAATALSPPRPAGQQRRAATASCPRRRPCSPCPR